MIAIVHVSLPYPSVPRQLVDGCFEPESRRFEALSLHYLTLRYHIIRWSPGRISHSHRTENRARYARRVRRVKHEIKPGKSTGLDTLWQNITLTCTHRPIPSSSIVHAIIPFDPNDVPRGIYKPQSYYRFRCHLSAKGDGVSFMTME